MPPRGDRSTAGGRSGRDRDAREARNRESNRQRQSTFDAGRPAVSAPAARDTRGQGAAAATLAAAKDPVAQAERTPAPQPEDKRRGLLNISPQARATMKQFSPALMASDEDWQATLKENPLRAAAEMSVPVGFSAATGPAGLIGGLALTGMSELTRYARSKGVTVTNQMPNAGQRNSGEASTTLLQTPMTSTTNASASTAETAAQKAERLRQRRLAGTTASTGLAGGAATTLFGF